MNNIKLIREMYGATQEQIARAIGVNRVTVANWENGSSTASSANREKMSIYFGIGPEYFYEKPLNDEAKELLFETAEKARKVVASSDGRRNKEEDFHRLLSKLTFAEAMSKYMLSMKLLLAMSDSGDLQKLETASTINRKMGARLDAIIKLRKEEEEAGERSINQLLEELSEEEEK